MKKIDAVFTIFLLLLAVSVSQAQNNNYELSKPLDLKLAGVNKVLQMSNGNTLLFHFEPSKAITVKVFDHSRKEIASRQEWCHYLDIYLIQDARFKGLFEIGGEAVLFFDQQNMIGRHRLVRLRFSGTDGQLKDETVLAESKSNEKRIRFYVMNNKLKGKYAVLYAMVENFRRKADLNVEYFSSSHEVERTVQLDVDRSRFDYLDITGADYLDCGVVVSLALSKVLQNGTISHGNTYGPAGSFPGPIVPDASQTTSDNLYLTPPARGSRYADQQSENYDEFDPTPSRFRHILSVYFIPEDGSPIKKKDVDATPDIYPYHSFLTHNDFSNAINLLLFSYKDAYVMYGLDRLPAAVMDNIFLRLDDKDLKTTINPIRNQMANKYLQEKTDSSKIFLGAAVASSTNQYGLSTLVSESFTRYANTESRLRPRLFETWLGDIAITRFDDDGKELYGAVIPRAQYYKSYKHYYYSGQLSAKWHDQMLLDDLPEQVYNRQFISLNVFTQAKNSFLILNDADRNFNLNAGKTCDSVYLFENTNAVYYTINSKKELTRNYVFGKPLRGEYKCSFIEGADFDDKTAEYAALIQYKKGGSISLRMAWAHL